MGVYILAMGVSVLAVELPVLAIGVYILAMGVSVLAVELPVLIMGMSVPPAPLTILKNTIPVTPGEVVGSGLSFIELSYNGTLSHTSLL